MVVKKGRPKGRKNLKRTAEGGVILQNGDIVSLKEQRALKSAVVLATKKRKELIAKLPKEAKERYKNFGVDSDFVVRHKSASLGRFRNKREFDVYLQSLQQINTQGYMSKVMQTYRSNLYSALRKTFNSSGDELVDFLDTVSDDELRKLSLDDSFKDIGWVYYEKIAVKEKLKVLRYQVTIIRNREARTGHKAKR